MNIPVTESLSVESKEVKERNPPFDSFLPCYCLTARIVRTMTACIFPIV
jgi:hypothetical protein